WLTPTGMAAGHLVWNISLPGSTGPANPSFESGLTGWTSLGTTASGGGGRGGTRAATLGSASPTNGDSTLSQTFTVPSGATLSLWYLMACHDTISHDWATATVHDNVTGTDTTVL